MAKVKRTLEEVQTEIKSHRDAIKTLEQEVKDFRSGCPHPKNFSKVDRSSTTDEYGSLDGYFVTTTCLLCGHAEHKSEDVERSRYR